MSSHVRLKILVLNPFPVYPPVSGGQARVFHLFRYAAASFNVVIVCFADRRVDNVIAPGLRQIQVPKSHTHCLQELELFREIGFPSSAILTKTAELTPEYSYRVTEQAKDACIIVLSHPYLYKEAQQSSGLLVYDAHNVEADLQAEILPSKLHNLLEDVKIAETSACRQSQLISACSQADADKLASLYNVSKRKFTITPNGVDTQTIPFTTYEQKLSRKALTFERPKAVFMGSSFPLNIQAAEQVIKTASQLPNVDFWLIGGVCASFAKQRLPDNIKLHGVVSEKEKIRLLGLADIALNPVKSGSGTNLKMLEYMSAGLPVITTLHGARGICEGSESPFLVRDCKDMTNSILALLDNPSLAAKLAQQAYLLTKTRFSWQQIAASFVSSLAEAAAQAGIKYERGVLYAASTRTD